MNIGVLGGTFDPPHVGHLIVAQDAAIALDLDRVLFIPASVPPHKQNRTLTPAAVRARMLDLAVRGDARFGMDPIELERAGPSWTVDTLRELAAREPDVQWTLLMGADQYAEFATWRDPGVIRQLARIAVLTRAGVNAAAVDTLVTGGTGGSGGSAHRPAIHELMQGDVAVEVTRVDVSATVVRRRVAERLPIRFLVPLAVEEFIYEQGLYETDGLYVGNGTPATG